MEKVPIVKRENSGGRNRGKGKRKKREEKHRKVKNSSEKVYLNIIFEVFRSYLGQVMPG